VPECRAGGRAGTRSGGMPARPRWRRSFPPDPRNVGMRNVIVRIARSDCGRCGRGDAVDGLDDRRRRIGRRSCGGNRHDSRRSRLDSHLPRRLHRRNDGGWDRCHDDPRWRRRRGRVPPGMKDYSGPGRGQKRAGKQRDRKRDAPACGPKAALRQRAYAISGSEGEKRCRAGSEARKVPPGTPAETRFRHFHHPTPQRISSRAVPGLRFFASYLLWTPAAVRQGTADQNRGEGRDACGSSATMSGPSYSKRTGLRSKSACRSNHEVPLPQAERA